MVKYTCGDCGKVFIKEDHYVRHIQGLLCKRRGKLKFIDLFSGIGGFHQALTRLDCECNLACDIDKNCRKVYQMNYLIQLVYFHN